MKPRGDYDERFEFIYERYPDWLEVLTEEELLDAKYELTHPEETGCGWYKAEAEALATLIDAERRRRRSQQAQAEQQAQTQEHYA